MTQNSAPGAPKGGDNGGVAVTPSPPYTAVIFTSLRTGEDAEGYERAAAEMELLARGQTGYLGIESARDPLSGTGVTVSYWASEQDARAWKQVAEHLEVQRLGRRRWYQQYRVRIAQVTREYRFDRPAVDGTPP